MGKKAEIVLVDTNIFVIDLRYRKDRHFKKNKAFLDLVAQNHNGFTSIVNLLELCGILSFNLNENQLLDLWAYFYNRYQITVLPEPEFGSIFPGIEIKRLFDIMRKKSAFGDALIVAVAEKYLPFASTLITWDKAHFKNKFGGTVLTPEEYVDDYV